MSENLNLLIALFMGLGLGTIFFYGLWRTLGKITTSKSPALWILGSAISRISITLAGFYLVATLHSDGQLKRILLCLLGFLIARFSVKKMIQSLPKKAPIEIEVRRAP